MIIKLPNVLYFLKNSVSTTGRTQHFLLKDAKKRDILRQKQLQTWYYHLDLRTFKEHF